MSSSEPAGSRDDSGSCFEGPPDRLPEQLAILVPPALRGSGVPTSSPALVIVCLFCSVHYCPSVLLPEHVVWAWASPAAGGVDHLFMCLLSRLCIFSGGMSIPFCPFSSGLFVFRLSRKSSFHVDVWIRVSLTVCVICSYVLPSCALPSHFLCGAL